MRKVGTLSSAIGFIYLGIWMIVNKINSNAAQAIFKWWPVIIILLGIEVIMYYNRRAENEHVGFNGSIILVFLIFIGMNTYMGLNKTLDEGTKWLKENKFSNFPIIFSDLDNDRYKSVNFEKVVDNPKEKISINLDNTEINIKKSQDSSLKVQGKIYVPKESNTVEYEPQEEKSSNETKVNLKNTEIRKVEATIYIPSGIELCIDGNNVSVRNSDEIPDSKITIKASNGNAELNSVKSATVNLNNGNIKIKDTREVKLECNNGNIDVKGQAENVDIKSNNGKVEVENEVCKNVNISANIGIVKLTTEDKNIYVNVNLDKGAASVNGDKRVNSGISKVFGDGTGKVQIRLNNGTINVRND